MIRNAILGLFLLILAFPAVAQPLCHQDAVPVAPDCHESASAHHDAPQAPDAPEPAAKAQHVCIGCIAPFAPISAPDALAMPAMAYAPVLAVQLTGGNALPATPPPKS